MMETLLLVAQHRNRTFQSDFGIMATPLLDSTTPITKQACSYSSSPKTPLPFVYPHHSEESDRSSGFMTIGSIPVSVNIKANRDKEDFYGESPYSELWAGPAYSNSPEPSSLPIPKFSLRPKRSASLNLPSSSASDISFHPVAKSAPPSPMRDRTTSFSRDVFNSDDSATKNLRRILNLDIEDE
ncbi:hypothetical protein RHMOL_Rhmol13G0034800 [Rhododendron molle]|uniref:Uncharacterized protein n=1 Tax=Rhododendron molle TaxID=49168 RepID=A0ACC0L2G5_RHOML|nr:hypothetical protein RHMOL_Rhmol13G0034800 [Rhododendron molle]